MSDEKFAYHVEEHGEGEDGGEEEAFFRGGVFAWSLIVGGRVGRKPGAEAEFFYCADDGGR